MWDKAKIEKLDALIKAGEGATVRSEFEQAKVSKIPRKHLAEMARIGVRVGSWDATYSMLQYFSGKAALSPTELIPFAMCLK